MIYRVAEIADWVRAIGEGHFASPDLAAEGFIHFAEQRQVQGVVNRHYADKEGLVLLMVDESRLEVPVKRENTSGGTELFPHVHGRVPLAAVRDHALLQRDADGRVIWPHGW